MKSPVRIRRPVAILSSILTLFLIVAIVRPAVTNAFAKQVGEGANPSSLIRVQAASIDPHEKQRPDRQAIAAMRTQELLITSPIVLRAVAVDPEVAALPFIQEGPDAEQAIRDHLNVRTLEGTSLIQVSSRGLEPKEGAIVVNAVVQAYLEEVVGRDRAARISRGETLAEIYEGFDSRFQAKERELRDLTRFTLVPEGPEIDRSIVEEDFLDCLRHLRRIRLDRLALRSRLDTNGQADTEDDGRENPDLRAELAAIDRQEAMLVEERDRLAETLAEGPQARQIRQELEQIGSARDKVGDEIEAMNVELAGPAAAIVIERARP